VLKFEELCKTYEKKYPESSEKVYIHNKCGRKYKQQDREE